MTIASNEGILQSADGWTDGRYQTHYLTALWSILVNIITKMTELAPLFINEYTLLFLCHWKLMTPPGHLMQEMIRPWSVDSLNGEFMPCKFFPVKKKNPSLNNKVK